MRIDWNPSPETIKLLEEFKKLRQTMGSYDAAEKIGKTRTYLLALCRWDREVRQKRGENK